MADPAKKVATYNDLFDLPGNMVGEVLCGALVTHPRPGPRHAHAASMASASLIANFGSKVDGVDSEWWILFEPECHLGADIVVPDIAGWRKSSMAELPDTAWFSLRPDWVCEVISPSTAKVDRGVKREIYARVGVAHYWIVDPIEKMIEVFVLQDERWVLSVCVSDNQVANLVPFDALPFDLSALWV